VSLTKEDHALGGMRRVHCVDTPEAEAFCAWATKRFRSSLPKGYVVRLPTEAEWEYALKANSKDPNDPYVKMSQRQNDFCLYQRFADRVFPIPEFKDCFVTFQFDLKPRLQAAGLWTKEFEEAGKTDSAFRKCFSYIPGTEVGTKKPNTWELFDMVGNLGELMLDTVDKSRIPRVKDSYNWNDQEALCYSEEENDPLHWVPKGVNLQRGGQRVWTAATGKILKSPVWTFPFRLCIGPDLMKEKGFKK